MEAGFSLMLFRKIYQFLVSVCRRSFSGYCITTKYEDVFEGIYELNL